MIRGDNGDELEVTVREDELDDDEVEVEVEIEDAADSDTDTTDETDTETDTETEESEEDTDKLKEDEPVLTAQQRAFAKREKKLRQAQEALESEKQKFYQQRDKLNADAQRLEPAFDSVDLLVKGIMQENADLAYEGMRGLKISPLVLQQLIAYEKRVPIPMADDKEVEAMKAQLAEITAERDALKTTTKTAEQKFALLKVVDRMENIMQTNNYTHLAEAAKKNSKLWAKAVQAAEDEYLSYPDGKAPDDNTIFKRVLKSMNASFKALAEDDTDTSSKPSRGLASIKTQATGKQTGTTASKPKNRAELKALYRRGL